MLDVDHPTLSPDSQVLSPTPPHSPTLDESRFGSRYAFRPPTQSQTWSSPAFLKRKHALTSSFFDSAYDPFFEEDDTEEGFTQKRTKFGRASGQWRFVERTPSPEKEIAALVTNVMDGKNPIYNLVAQSGQNGMAEDSETVSRDGLPGRSPLTMQIQLTQGKKSPALAIANGTQEIEDTLLYASERFDDGNTQSSLMPKVVDEITVPAKLSKDRLIVDQPKELNPQELVELGKMQEREASETVESVTPRTDRFSSEGDLMSRGKLKKKQVVRQLALEQIDSSAKSAVASIDQECQQLVLQRKILDPVIAMMDDGPEYTTTDEQVISQLEPSNTLLDVGYISVDVDIGITSREKVSLESKREIVIPNASYVPGDGIRRTPEPPRLRPLPSPGLPIVSPILDRRGKSNTYLDSYPNSRLSPVLSGDSEPISAFSVSSRITGEILDRDEVFGGRVEPYAGISESRGPSIPIPSDEEAILRFQECDLSKLEQIHSTNTTIKEPSEHVPLSLSVPLSDFAGFKSDSIERSRDEPAFSEHTDDFSRETTPNERMERVKSARQQEDPTVHDLTVDQIEEIAEAEFAAATDIEKDRSVPSLMDQQDSESDSLHSEDEQDDDSHSLLTRNETISLKEESHDITSPYDTEEEYEYREDEIEKARILDLNNQRVIEVIDLGIAEEENKEDGHDDHGEDHEHYQHDLYDEAVNSPGYPHDHNHTDLEQARVKEFLGGESSPTTQLLAELGGRDHIPAVYSLEERLVDSDAIAQTSNDWPVSLSRQSPMLSKSDHILSKPQPAELGHNNETIPLPDDTSEASLPKSRLRNEMITPVSTQETGDFLNSSQRSLQSNDENYKLPTPQPTQSLSEGVAELTPVQRRSSLIDRLKSLRTASAQDTIASHYSRTAKVISPWFATKPSEKSEDESESGHESIAERDKSSESRGVYSEQIHSEASSPEVEKPILDDLRNATAQRTTSKAGFRTPLSYYASLSALTEYFNSTTDVLAVVVSSTAPIRAKLGPRDFYQTLYLTDFSSSPKISKNPLTTAQIFRPHKEALPTLRCGDCLLLRNFKVQTQKQKQKPILLSTNSSAWAVFRGDADVQVRGPPVELGDEETNFAKDLREWWDTLTDEDQGAIIDAVPKEKDKSKAKDRDRRKSWVDGRHELRDGTTYTDEPLEERNAVHELRDGTTWKDAVM